MLSKLFMRDLSYDSRKFVQLQVFFTGMNAILALFVNVFLLSAFSSTSGEVLLYNAIMALVQPVSMILAMKLEKCKNALYTQRMGFVFYGLGLVLLSVFGEKIASLYPLFAVILSFGAGFYYSIYSIQMLYYTNDSNRDKIAGAIGFLGSVISILLPLISGILLSVFGAEIGYKIVFAIAAAFAVFALLTNKYLSPLPKRDEKTLTSKVAKTIFQSKKGRLIMIANGFSNCRSATIPIFITLLFYNLAPDELLISVNTVINYAVALLGSGVYSVLVKSENRVKASVIAAFTVAVPVLFMLFGLNIALIMVFNAICGFFTTFMGTPVLNVHFKVMEELGLGSEYGAQIHLVRELFVSAGRILGLVLVWAVPQTNTGAVVVLICMAAMELINSAILHRIEKYKIIYKKTP
ncbi:MAG: MFS transporter [Ruminococcaceae bacterium]|nr:MFS transporter [Oscillospiraceae bacterium]